MPKYKVTIEKKTFYQVTVNADNEVNAERIALYNTDWESQSAKSIGTKIYTVEEEDETT